MDVPQLNWVIGIDLHGNSRWCATALIRGLAISYFIEQQIIKNTIAYIVRWQYVWDESRLPIGPKCIHADFPAAKAQAEKHLRQWIDSAEWGN